MVLGIDASRANNKQKTGVEWYAYHLIQELKKIIPEEIQVVLYSDKPLQGDLADLPKNWRSKVLHWPPKRLWTQVRLSFEMFISPPDVLFIPAHVFPIIHPKKTIMTVHDIAAIKFPESYNWFERWYSLWSAKRALKKLWKIIVPSEFAKKELSVFGDQTSISVEVVKHGFDKRYKVISDEDKINSVLQKYKINKPFIMTVGRLEEKKNTVRIIKAFNMLKDRNSNLQLRLLLVGNPGHGYKKVEQAMQNSPYKNDIMQPGWVGEKDLPYIMNAAEVFVFPSLYEGFGLPVLEAFACGTPTVVSKDSSLEEVSEGASVLVDPQSVEEICNGVLNLLDNSNLRQEKIELGLERVEKFSWKKCASDTFEIIGKK